MRILLVSALVFVSVMAVAAAPQAQDDIVPALRKGSYVLFLRHTATNPEQADTDPLNLNNIKSQRQLTDKGRNQAKALGAALKKLKIPVGKILASKFYRARETAELLDLGEVESVLDITEGGLVVSPRENQRRAARSARSLPPRRPRQEHNHHQPQAKLARRRGQGIRRHWRGGDSRLPASRRRKIQVGRACRPIFAVDGVGQVAGAASYCLTENPLSRINSQSISRNLPKQEITDERLHQK